MSADDVKVVTVKPGGAVKIPAAVSPGNGAGVKRAKIGIQTGYKGQRTRRR